ncbi:two-component system sensor histidine kinase DesK [Nakamurella sp. UYEF19]|uniref:sensor histidine kinase n=1 Tax=Nakamurella sp. UYEF19 TaxID=1756392 RepID=UPI003393DB8B
MTDHEYGTPTVKEIRRRWIPGSTIGMIFLLYPAVDIVRSHDAVLPRILGVLVVLVIGSSYVFVTPAAMFFPIGKQLGLLVGLLAVSAVAWPVAGSGLVVFWMFIGITAGATLSMRHTAIVVGFLAVGMLLLSRIDHQDAPWELAGTLIGLSLWMCAFMGNIRLTRELQDTRQELANAAVVSERERIGRDLHDILGHSLTAIAVKAGLARRMVERHAEGAAQEIADVERLAREALADVRATASGYREVSLGSEIAVAAMTLRAAGIEPRVPQAVDDVDPAARELFGYVVREAVTNVVRHSGATRCTVTVGVDYIEIVDDGKGSNPTGQCGAASNRDEPTDGGSGLRGLCVRVREAGGTLDAGPLPRGGFSVRAVLTLIALPAPGDPARSASPVTGQVGDPVGDWLGGLRR